MRTFAHIALLGLASALKLTQDPIDTPPTGDNDGTPDIVISDILHVVFDMFDEDNNGTISQSEFSTNMDAFITELESHGYSCWYLEEIRELGDEADQFFEEIDEDWNYRYVEEYGYDAYVNDADGELTYEEF